MPETKIVPLEKNHLETAAALVAARYREGRKSNPLWSEKRRQPEDILRVFEHQKAEQLGVAAVRGGKVAGFMISLPWDNFGLPVMWIPDWAHGAAEEERGETYRRMYAALAQHRVAEGRLKHSVEVFAYEREVLDAFCTLGFGMHGLEAMCGLEPVAEHEAEIAIRKAGPQDISTLMQLRWLLSQHLRQAPAFAYFPDTSIEAGAADFERQVKNDDYAIFLACRGNEIIGAMRASPPSPEEFKMPVYDQGTCSISMAFTREDLRGKGVATALRNAVLAWGRKRGSTRCCVDFESANLPGARFWLKHFQPVCYGLTRFIDNRVYTQLMENKKHG